MSRLHGSTVWVGDDATGRIHVYRLDGTQLRVINTRLGRDRLTGFRVDSDGSLSVLDVRENRTLRLRASQT
jgi:6-phosphogluconolactonase (cycloisomerase 2 family)